MTHIWIRKDVVNGRGIGVKHDVAAGGRDVVLESKVRVRTLPQTSPSIAAEESFPQGFDKDFNHRGAEKFAWHGIVNVGQAFMRAQAPHRNTVYLNIGE